MARFKIVSVGWRAAAWWQQTLRSVENQSLDSWDIWIVYDGGDDAGQAIQEWCDDRDERWNCTINPTRQFAVRNQYEAIRRLEPADDDIVVFLDLDGDMLAHLGQYYLDGTLVTYGSYKPVPRDNPVGWIAPFPANVVRTRTYRKFTREVGCCWNHLRTMSGAVANAMPVEAFKWAKGPRRGQWYEVGTDYVFMMAALELANGRYKCIRETLLLYNHANPLADNVAHPQAGTSGVADALTRAPLPPLVPLDVRPGPEPVAPPAADRFRSLEPEDRRAELAAAARAHGLKVLIETGTNQGLTPLALRDDFREIYTIELHTGLWRDARRKLAPYPHVHCLRGDSTDQLPVVLGTIKDPAVVWLDGHYSGPSTARGRVSTPIRDELRTLFEDGRPHVILVDDARIFDGGPEHALYEHYADYPSLEWVAGYAAEHGYSYELRNDIIRLVPRGVPGAAD